MDHSSLRGAIFAPWACPAAPHQTYSPSSHVPRQADPNAAADGQTPLLAALVLGNTGLAGVLISRGADTNRPGPDGKTPLLVAIANSSVASAEELLDNVSQAGAVPDAADLSDLKHTPCVCTASGLLVAVRCPPGSSSTRAQPQHPHTT